MKRFAATLLIVMFIVGCGGCGDPTSEVKASFSAFQTALAEQNGAAAAAYVTPGTIEMYEGARKLALDSSGADFESQPQFIVLLVLQLRHDLPKERLEAMDGAALFAWGVDEGRVSKEAVSAVGIDKVTIAGDTATATFKEGDLPIDDMVRRFELHGGVWKLDYIPIVKAAEAPLAQMREQMGMTKVELAVYVIEQAYKEKVPPEILDGPLK